MKRFRLPAFVAGALVVLLVLVVAVAFNSSFQTWVARRAIASQPGVHASIGSVSAGMKQVHLKDLRFEHGGVVLTLPSVEIDVPLMTAGWDKKVAISRLVVKGWTLDFSKASGGPVAPSSAAQVSPPAPQPPTVSPALRETATAVGQVFAGIFSQLELPVDVSMDGVQIEGDVILPESRGRGKLTLTGGGLGVGKEGKFDLAASAALNDPSVKTVEVRGGFAAAMNTPRTFTRITSQLDAAAKGEKFPQGVKLHAEIAAERVVIGETYSTAVVTEGQEIFSLKAEFPRNAKRLGGSWKIDVRDADIAPFALGQPLPSFTAVGEGKFDTDAGFSAIHVLGRLNASVDRLQVIRPELAVVGELKIAADFDLAGQGGTIGVQKFEVAVGAARPIASIRTLQAFEFNRNNGELRAADPAIDLLGITLEGVPVEWAKPFLKGIEVNAGSLRGEIAASARGGGMTLRSTQPLMLDGVSVVRAGKPLVQGVDLALSASADLTPQGWQAEISRVTAKSGETTLTTIEAKAGQLFGNAQSIKATGKLVANLPAILAQPAVAGSLVVTAGDATADFVVSLNEKKEIQASVALKDLATEVEAKPVKLPIISSQLRADISADGTLTFNAPLVLERDERKSDLTIIGTIGPEKDKQRAIDAEVTSAQLIVEDAQILAAVLPVKKTPAVQSAKTDLPPAPSRDAAPPWAGVHGSLALQLASVVYSDTFQLSNLTGRLRIDAGMLKLEGMQAGLGGGGRANLSGVIRFDAAAPRPYALAADVVLKEFDPTPLFRAMSGDRPPTVEGRFDLTSKLASSAITFGDLATGAGGNFQITSKGGVFRGLPVNVSNIAETTGKIAALIASVGTGISAMTGRKDEAEVANKAEAVAELVRGWNPIHYDQLSVVLSRDAALNTTLKDFTLIAPELRLSGSGTALHKSGSCLLDDSLAMEFTLRARGRQGDLLKYLGAIESQTDDLGYATCTVPLRVSGSLGKPDTSEVNGKLTALALEKSGFGDKATELLNKIRGK